MIKMSQKGQYLVEIDGLRYKIDVDKKEESISKKVPHEIIVRLVDNVIDGHWFIFRFKMRIYISLWHFLRLIIYRKFLEEGYIHDANEVRAIDNDLNNSQYDAEFNAIFEELKND